jgi:hypothetical protein
MPESNSRLLVEAELRTFSRELDTALEPLDLSSAVIRRLEASRASVRPRVRSRRRRLVAVLVATVAVAATLAIPTARAAVTSFFDVGAVRVHEEPPPGGRATAGPLLLGEPATLDAARAAMPAVVPAARGFGSPDEVWFDAKGGGVTSLVYRARPEMPAAKHTPGIGLLIQEYAGDGSGFLHKYLTNGSRAEQVAVGPYDGVFITGGSHFLAYDDATGAGATDDGRLAGNALIFQRQGLTIRIEGDVSRDRMVAIGASLR